VPAVSFPDLILAANPGTAGIKTMTLNFFLSLAAHKIRSTNAYYQTRFTII
jgi:hypothetical protein